MWDFSECVIVIVTMRNPCFLVVEMMSTVKFLVEHTKPVPHGDPKMPQAQTSPGRLREDSQEECHWQHMGGLRKEGVDMQRGIVLCRLESVDVCTETLEIGSRESGQCQ